MNKEEEKILNGLVKSRLGELSPSEFINGIAQSDERSVQHLISKGYIATTIHQNRDLNGNYYDIPFYHATHKGLVYFEPWYKRIWFSFKGDVRTIIVALVTSLGTSLITIFVSKFFQ